MDDSSRGKEQRFSSDIKCKGCGKLIDDGVLMIGQLHKVIDGKVVGGLIGREDDIFQETCMCRACFIEACYFNFGPEYEC